MLILARWAKKMITYGLLFWGPFSFILWVYIIYFGKKHMLGYPYYLIAFVSSIYFNKLIDVAFFPIRIEGAIDIESVGLLSFVDLSFNFPILSFEQIYGNILMTLPLGVFLPFISNVDNLKRTILTIILAFSVEFIQLLMIISMHRVDTFFDVKDIILNVTGALLGLFLFKVFSGYIYKKNYQVSGDIIGFIVRVCINREKYKKSYT